VAIVYFDVRSERGVRGIGGDAREVVRQLPGRC
jgi:hypothetical protein